METKKKFTFAKHLPPPKQEEAPEVEVPIVKTPKKKKIIPIDIKKIASDFLGDVNSSEIRKMLGINVNSVNSSLKSVDLSGKRSKRNYSARHCDDPEINMAELSPSYVPPPPPPEPIEFIYDINGRKMPIDLSEKKASGEKIDKKYVFKMDVAKAGQKLEKIKQIYDPKTKKVPEPKLSR